MKSDLNALFNTHNLDAILVTGPAQHNPAMVYLTGGGHLTSADLIYPRGREPVLFYNPMERDEAAHTGLTTRNLADFPFDDYLKDSSNDFIQANAMRYRQMLTDLGITSGRLAIYGQSDAGNAFALFSQLQRLMPELTLVGEMGNSVLLEAMATKDAGEIERIRRMGLVTTGVVGKVADFLTSHSTRDEFLVDNNGQPITIGQVKSQINLWLAAAGAENPEGTIFAIGRDAGVPHSSGASTDLLRLGQTIVFDIFPCEAGGGYFYDFTRTWCLGYAPDEALSLYEDVLKVYQQIKGELKAGTQCREYQIRACELFEQMGHPTIHTNPKTQEGYVHSLGHGLGLQVHERPAFGKSATSSDRLDPGVVFTIEPGLYYPERGLGVRLEDTAWVRPDGQIEVLAEYSMDLVLPMH